MDATLYRQMAEVQATHWWFAGRRAILESVLRALGLPPGARILEVGCGPGGNLPMLCGFGRVAAMELDAFALDEARRTAAADVRRGWLPDGIPFGSADRFDLICLFDVLEHIRDDAGALASLAPFLAPGGRVLVTVPAYPWLYGPHDRAHHHHRRYTTAALRGTAAASGFSLQRCGHFNALLFPLIVAMRLLARIGVVAGADDARLPGDAANRLLTAVFGAERHVLARTGFPFGASLLAVLGRAG